MARDVSDATPIGARHELVDWIASGEKPRSAWRLGTEHEKVPFYVSGHAPVPYEGERGIRALLDGLRQRTGWQPIMDRDLPIGLADDEGGSQGGRLRHDFIGEAVEPVKGVVCGLLLSREAPRVEAEHAIVPV